MQLSIKIKVAESCVSCVSLCFIDIPLCVCTLTSFVYVCKSKQFQQINMLHINTNAHNTNIWKHCLILCLYECKNNKIKENVWNKTPEELSVELKSGCLVGNITQSPHKKVKSFHLRSKAPYNRLPYSERNWNLASYLASVDWQLVKFYPWLFSFTHYHTSFFTRLSLTNNKQRIRV